MFGGVNIFSLFILSRNHRSLSSQLSPQNIFSKLRISDWPIMSSTTTEGVFSIEGVDLYTKTWTVRSHSHHCPRLQQESYWFWAAWDPGGRSSSMAPKKTGEWIETVRETSNIAVLTLTRPRKQGTRSLAVLKFMVRPTLS